MFPLVPDTGADAAVECDCPCWNGTTFSEEAVCREPVEGGTGFGGSGFLLSEDSMGTWELWLGGTMPLRFANISATFFVSFDVKATSIEQLSGCVSLFDAF